MRNSSGGSGLTPINNESIDALTTQRSTFNSEAPRHNHPAYIAPVCQKDFGGGGDDPQQLNARITSTLSSRYAPLYACDVSSSSSAFDTATLINDDYDDYEDDCSKHQFGSKPTRASTSIGTFLPMHRAHRMSFIDYTVSQKTSPFLFL